MRHTALSIATVLVATIVISAHTTRRVDATGATRTVQGRVADANTAAGLTEVLIVVPGQRIGTKSAEKGVFRLPDVPDGIAKIEFRHPCYFSVEVAIPATGDVDLELGIPFDKASLRRPGCGGLGARGR